MGEVYIGIDLGGTKIKGILMNDDGLIVYQYSTSTGNNLNNLFEVIENLIQASKNMSSNLCGILRSPKFRLRGNFVYAGNVKRNRKIY